MSRNNTQLAIAKKLLQKPAGDFKAIDLSLREHPAWMTRAFMNNHYVVMINDFQQMTHGVTAIKAMVQRHDDKPIPFHWRELNKIKNALFGDDAVAVEYYPPKEKLMNDANIYWLFVFKPGDIPEAVL